MIFIGIILFSIGKIGFKYHNNESQEQEFIEYHLTLIDTIIAIADRDLEDYGSDWTTDFPCDYIRNRDWLNKISMHLQKYDYIGMFSIEFNLPMICMKSLAFNEHKFTMSHRDFYKKNFKFKLKNNMYLSVYVDGFKQNKPNFEDFQGRIEIHSEQTNDENQKNDFMYIGKYGITATILIPKDFAEWKEKVQSKSLKEVLDGSTKL